MKIKVKGLVFVGAAAAIMLSAGAANAAKTARTPAASTAGVVTSQKYTESTYEYVADKVEAQATQAALGAIVNNSTNSANDNKYPSLSAMKQYVNSGTAGELAKFGTNGLEQVTFVSADEMNAAIDAATSEAPYVGDDNHVLSEAAVVDALDALKEAIGGTDTAKQQASNSAAAGTYKVGHTGDTWATLGADDYVSIDTTDTSAPEIKLTAGRITTNVANVNSTTGTAASNLVTAGVVQKKQTTGSTYQVSKDADWEAVDNAIDVTSGDYLAKDSARTDGGVRLKIDPTKVVSTEAAVTSGTTQLVTASGVQGYSVANQFGAAESVANAGDSADKNKVLTIDGAGRVTMADYAMQKSTTALTTSNAADTTVPTTKTVTDFVTTAMGGYTLPTMNSDCNNANAHCALVTSYDAGTSTLSMSWVPMAQP